MRWPARAWAACIRSTRFTFVATVQCVWSSSIRAAGAPAAASSSRAVRPASAAGATTPRPAHSGQDTSSSGWPAATAARPAVGERGRPGVRDHAALAQLVAGGGDDGNGQLGQPADLPDRGRLGGQQRGQDVPDPGLALGQPDRRRDLA